MEAHMKTPEGISLTPTSYQEIVALLTSEELASVECPIADQCRLRIIHDLASTTTSHLQAEVSVSGMTVAELTQYLALYRNQLVAFGVRFLGDSDATKEEQEFAEGEEQDTGGESKTMGLRVGFGVKCAIYHNFLANRPVAEFRAFLRNRRIPKHTKFAKELERVFAATGPLNSENA